MLYAFQALLSLKLCWHNRLKPSYGYNNVVININFAHDVKIAQIVAMHSEMILSEA